MLPIVHATARICRAPTAAAMAHLSTLPGMSRWILGLWNCREAGPGLYRGESLFDGSVGFLRVEVDAARGTVDYHVGATPDALAPRIRASVAEGGALGHPPECCVVTLQAWRTAGMDDARWQRLIHTHETEIELVRAQLESDVAAAAAADASTVAAAEPASAPAASRRFIASGSPWEELAGYSRAVVEGDWVWVAGTVGVDFATLAMPDGAEAQAELALDTIEAALARAGAALADVVRVRVYVPDPADVAAVSGVLKRRFAGSRPVNTTVCAPLAVPQARVEIEVTALRRRPAR